MKDRTFKQLHQVTDSTFMASMFDELFKRDYTQLGLKMKSCKVLRTYHKPGKSCTVTYRLAGLDRKNRPFDNWFIGEISKNGLKESNRKKHPLHWSGCDFWKPVTIWPELNMRLYAFPYDTRLPQLGQLLDTDFVSRKVENNLSCFGLSGGWKCKDVVCHKIKYRRGKSCVLRYEIFLNNPSNAQKQIEFYSKTYKTSISSKVYKVLTELSEDEAYRNGVLRIPKPFVHLDEENTVWQQACSGTNLSRVIRKFGLGKLLQSKLFSNIASMLSVLQQVEITSFELSLAPSPGTLVATVQEDMEKIAEFVPGKTRWFRQIGETSAKLAPNPENYAKTTIHGSFKIGQILCENDEVSIVDFDSISDGDPLYDVAEFIASLNYLQVSDNFSEKEITEVSNLFLGMYEESVPWKCDSQRLAWYVIIFLLAKIHSSCKKIESNAVENIDVAFPLVEKWLSKIN